MRRLNFSAASGHVLSVATFKQTRHSGLSIGNVQKATTSGQYLQRAGSGGVSDLVPTWLPHFATPFAQGF